MYGYDLSNTQSNPNHGDVTKETVSQLAPSWTAVIGGGATGTPLVSDGKVYFGGWDGWFYAVDSATGELAWKSQVGRQFVRSTPVLTRDRVYVAADSSLVALSREDGTQLWATPLIDHPQGFIESSPKVADGVVMLGLAGYELNLEKEDYTFEGSVVGVDAETGMLLWTVPVTGQAPGPCMGGSGVSVWSSVAVDPALGLAYIGTGQTYEEPASTCNDTLLAIHYKADYEGERVAWKQTFTPEDVYVAAGGGLNGLDHDIGATPNLFMVDDVEAVGVGDKGGTYRVFDRKTGDMLWRADLQASTTAQLGGVMTTAAVFEDTVFVASNQWNVFLFVLTGMHAPEDIATLYALDKNTGEPRWTQPLDAPAFATFAVSDGVLYHSTIRGVVYARDVETGEELWHADTGAPIGAGISVAKDAVYVASGFSMGGRAGNGSIIRYGLASGEPAQVDLREETFVELTAEQCQTALAELQPDAACRTCLCDCNASTTGSCHAGCWEQASCIATNCAEADFSGGVGSGMACYEEHCSSKLLPPIVYQESIRSAQCVLTCTEACAF